MTTFSIIIGAAIILYAGYLFKERQRQLYYARKKREPINMKNVDTEFLKLTDNMYAEDPKTDSEFWLGFALVALMDAYHAPEEYDDSMLNAVFGLAEQQERLFRLKYDKEISEVNQRGTL